MLKYQTNAKFTRLLRPINKHRLTIPKQLPDIWLQQPIGDFYEGGFASTILSQKRMNFAGMNAEGYIVIRNEVAKIFRNANSFKKWWRF